MAPRSIEHAHSVWFHAGDLVEYLLDFAEDLRDTAAMAEAIGEQHRAALGRAAAHITEQHLQELLVWIARRPSEDLA